MRAAATSITNDKMSDQRSRDSDGPPTPRAMSDKEVAKLWDQFRSGGVAHCPRDEAPLALAVDGASKSYRLVCTRCGHASLWFEVAANGIHVRGGADGAKHGASDD
jgi:hypothetical protein